MKKIKFMLVLLLITAWGRANEMREINSLMGKSNMDIPYKWESTGVFNTASASDYAPGIDNNFREGLTALTPLSPTAGALARYADYPVSHYTGVPQINIPLYDIKVGNYTLPISLSYHASGIKVSQEASWVGLGWSLNAGGCISRTVKCTDDFLEFGANFVSNGFYDINEITDKDDANYYRLHSTSNGFKYYLTVDSEPDIFTYNIPGYTGKFMLKNSRGIIQLNSDPLLKIEIVKSTGLRTYDFHVTTPDGVRYVFALREVTTSWSAEGSVPGKTTNPSSYDDKVTSYPGSGTTYSSSWLLTKIITTQNREINFTYEEEYYVAPSQESCLRHIYLSHSGSSTCGITNNNYNSRNKTEHKTFRLSGISWDNGSVTFESSNRDDVYSDSNLRKPKRLDGLVVRNNNGRIIKSYQLNYNYFNNNQTGTYAYVFKRLKLLSVVDRINPDFIYSLTYHEGTFPAKNSRNTDHWGYQNGKNYGTDYMPPVTYNGETYTGVDKSPVLSHTLIGTLKEIALPTGGSTVFTYELNEATDPVTNNVVPAGGLRIKTIKTGNKTRNFIYAAGTRMIEPFYSHLMAIKCTVGTSVEDGVIYLIQLSDPTTPITSLTSGIATGYTQVEESVRVNNTDHRTVYSFYCTPERLFNPDYPFSPTIPDFYNGLTKSIEYYSNRKLVRKIQNMYEASSNYTLLKAFVYHTPGQFAYTTNYRIETIRKRFETIEDYYDNNQQKSLSSKTFEYNQYNMPTKISYTGYGYDFSKQYRYLNESFGYYRPLIPQAETTISSKGVIDATSIQYKDTLGMYLPKTLRQINQSLIIHPNDLWQFYETEFTCDRYDKKGNLVQVSDKTSSNLYLWSYKGEYPVAEIKNATYQQVANILSAGFIETLLERDNPTQGDIVRLNSLRDSLPYAEISTYTWEPLLGVSTITDGRGFTTYYDYHEEGHFKESWFLDNGLKRILEYHTYNYKLK